MSGSRLFRPRQSLHRPTHHRQLQTLERSLGSMLQRGSRDLRERKRQPPAHGRAKFLDVMHNLPERQILNGINEQQSCIPCLVCESH